MEDGEFDGTIDNLIASFDELVMGIPNDECWAQAPVRTEQIQEEYERWNGEKSEEDLRRRSSDSSVFKNKQFKFNRKNLLELITPKIRDLMIMDDFLNIVFLLEFHILMLLQREHLQEIARHLLATNSGNKESITHAILNKRYKMD